MWLFGRVVGGAREEKRRAHETLGNHTILTTFYSFLSHCSQAAQTLEAESGYQLESPAVSRFRECVLSGNWTEVEQLTSQLNLDVNHGIAVRSFRFSFLLQRFLSGSKDRWLSNLID